MVGKANGKGGGRRGGRARNAKDTGRPAGEQEQPSAPARQIISQPKLRALMNAARSATKDMASVSGTIREKIGYAKENDHLHTGVFALIRRLDRMEPEKLADYLETLELYLDTSGLNDRAEKVVRMQFGPGKDAGEEGDDDGETTSDPKLRKAFPAPSSAPAD